VEVLQVSVKRARGLTPVGVEPDVLAGAGVPRFGIGGDGNEATTFRVVTTQNNIRTDAVGNVIPGSIGAVGSFGMVDPRDREKAAAYQLQLDKKREWENNIWNVLGDAVSPVKNFAAGAINAIVPGSNLGDSNNVFRDIGEAIGAPVAIAAGVGLIGAVSKVKAGAALVGAAEKVADVAEKVAAPVVKAVENITIPQSTMNLGKLIDDANTFIGSPVGQVIVKNLVPGPAQKAIGTVGVSPATPVPNYMTQAGPIGGVDSKPPGSVTPTKPTEMPSWLMPVALLLGLFLILKK